MSTTRARRLLLRFADWLDAKMKAHPDYDRNDPEWIEAQNESNSMRNDLRRQLNKSNREYNQ